MAPGVCEVLLTDSMLEAQPLTEQAESGAILDFWGVVRGREDEAEISGIEYEAHRQMAEHQLRTIAEEGRRTFALNGVWLHHRLGFVAVGEASLLLRVATGHRAQAYRASQWMVDELKKRVPIWKRPRLRE